jgi:hypothetical protein
VRFFSVSSSYGMRNFQSPSVSTLEYSTATADRRFTRHSSILATTELESLSAVKTELFCLPPPRACRVLSSNSTLCNCS